MKDKVLLLAIFSVFFNSCNSKDELGLTNPTKKWVYYNYEKKFDADSSRFMAYLKFDSNGKCVNLLFNGNQHGPYMDWNFKERDSILEISDNRFLIVKVYHDSILMKDLKYNRKVKMLNWNVLDK